MSEDTILEGFLCPICKQDLRNEYQLTTHFEKNHSEQQDLVQVFKGIFSNAKKKILNEDLFSTNTHAWIREVSHQNLGQTRSHSSWFKTIRNTRLERYAVETNKLLIRLDKLLTNIPAERSARKQHEQEVVQWLDGSLVKLCPSCTKSFSFTRRQHHCRLCGALHCNDCCRFLSLEIALSMTNPELTTTPTVLVEGPGLRLCGHCFYLLQARKHMQDTQNSRPPIVKLYEMLREIIVTTYPDIEMFFKMSNSLNDGESTYCLEDADTLRCHIGQRGSNVEKIGKAIASLACPEHHVSTKLLHTAVQQSAMIFLKDEVLSLPTLPTKEEYENLKERKRKETEQAIEAERKALEKKLDFMKITQDSNNLNNGKLIPISTRSLVIPQQNGVLEEGWTGSQLQTAGNSLLGAEANDPVIEQINIIQGYIRQAREAMRFEEVATLEANLRELKEEFYNRSKTVL
uniref:Putative fyve finger-containing protein n=1 Tax=Xenopsylla cheopis TaxID=163159 RepID=A0A6M2DS19_XENCH